MPRTSTFGSRATPDVSHSTGSHRGGGGRGSALRRRLSPAPTYTGNVLSRSFQSARSMGYDGGGMAEFILNPRRAARAPARCKAAVVSPAGWFETETEDIGAMGCQIVSPRLVKKDELLQLVVSHEGVGESLLVNGRIAWVSDQPPWRVGVAFDEASRRESARWFERLVAACPGLRAHARVPERIGTDSPVYLAAPPRFVLDFTADEAALLRAIGSGARIDELMARLPDRAAAQRALFSLIARQAVTFQRGHAAHPDSWKRILSELEASLAVEALGSPGPSLDSRGGTRGHEPAASPAPGGAGAAGPAAPPAGAATSAASAAAPSSRGEGEAIEVEGWTVETRHPVQAPTRPSAGSAWRGGRVERSAEAQAALDRAVAEIQGGSVQGAIALLRRALSLAPGDPEIAHLLGELAFKDRPPT